MTLDEFRRHPAYDYSYKVITYITKLNPENWIMSVDANNTDLAILSAYYHID